MGTGIGEVVLASPTITGTRTGPHGTGIGRVVCGGVVIEAGDDAGTILPVVTITAAPSLPSLAVFDAATGRTKIGNLKPLGGKFQDVQNEPGRLQFRLAMDNAANSAATGKRIVRCYWKGRARMSARLDESTTNVAVDGTIVREFDLPGILSIAGEGIVFPESGLRAGSGQTRTYGFMSERGVWYYVATWIRPFLQSWASDTGVRKRQPAGFRGTGAYWISMRGAYHPEDPDAQQWTRREFTVTTAFDYELIYAADDHVEVWIDNEEAARKQDSDGQSYRYLGVIRGRFEVGKHIIAAHFGNSRVASGHNSMAFIAAVRKTKANGDLVKGPPFLVTDRHWWISDDVPGHHRGEVLADMFDEAKARGVRAFRILRRGWARDRDSHGFGYADYGRHTVDVRRPVLDVAQQFTETGLDIDVEHDTGTVRLWKQQGADRTGSVVFAAGVGGSLNEHSVIRTEGKSNSALMLLGDDTWVVREDDASVAANGRAEIGFALGTTAWPSTADEIADSQFNETAHVTRSAKSSAVSLRGPQAYTHYFKGDLVMVPDEDGDGSMQARVIAITVDWDNAAETVKVLPDFEEDRT